MSYTLILDLRDKAELLTFLVASQLAAKSKSGDWLGVDDVVELERLWLQMGNTDVPWLERVAIASWSQTLAARLENEVEGAVRRDLTAELVSKTGCLDFRLSLVRMVYLHCFNHLAEAGWFLRGDFRVAFEDKP